MAITWGQVRARADGRIYVDVRPHGRIYSAHGAPFASLAEAEHVLSALRVAVASGTPRAVAVDRWLPVSSAAHRVDTWSRRWLERLRELESAGERSREYVDEIARWIGDGDFAHIAGFWSRRSIHEINYASLDDWQRWMAERVPGAKTRWNVTAAMRSMLGWLHRIGEIDAVPPIPWPRVQEHAPRIISAGDQRRILDEIDVGARGIFLALALLGLRPSEAMALRAGDYAAGDPPWLVVRRTKNRAAKRLPVPHELAEWIEARVTVEGRLRSAPMFAMPYSGRGRRPAGPWHATSLRRTWAAACRRAGVEVGLYEGTKHARATDLLRQGVPERVLQALLGHRDARSTRRYARLADQALVEVLRPRGGTQ